MVYLRVVLVSESASQSVTFVSNVPISNVRYAKKANFRAIKIGQVPAQGDAAFIIFFRVVNILLRNLKFQSTPLALKLSEHIMSRSMVALTKVFPISRPAALFTFVLRVRSTMRRVYIKRKN